MVNKLRMTREQTQRFLNPIIKFIKENPDLVKEVLPLQKNDTKTQKQSLEK
ncbi:hypothetical protein [Bacillus thuringiensis]|uniref:hypothetical protein n=1 Tax=Bacillus thuringiensis TaxID=1428 RepID=UPI0014825080|nr:hypothetical protein [Bacillus thuringiensis]MCU5281488.1 hypothetical protein [Bacillus cereus]MEB9862847.1 hypothetical protein [Bacillus cereus]MEC3271477.1 hypothetical protein [Bacillus thuringiensis]